MSFFGASKEKKEESTATELMMKSLVGVVENLQCQLKAKDVKIGILTLRHNSLIAQTIELRAYVKKLEDQLSKYVGSFKPIRKKKMRSFSTPVRAEQSHAHTKPATKFEHISRGEHVTEHLKPAPLDQNPLILPTPKNALVANARITDLVKYSPVNPEDIYLKMYSLEKEIKTHELDLYFKIKEFTFTTEEAPTYFEISHFAEDIAHLVYKKKKIESKWLRGGQVEFQHMVEELCFEIMYNKLFNKEDAEEEDVRNVKTQEKFFALQNLLTPTLLGIKPQFYSYNLYQLAFAELKKINSVKSPRNKCSTVLESINCLSGLFKAKMPSAEELFPIVAYLLVCSNPPHISRNLEYIDEYLAPNTKIGKEGFVLTTVSAALRFLQNIDASMLLKGIIQVKQQ